MGASSWSYVEPWAGSVEETFAAVQSRLFVEFFSDWPEDQRPAGIADLWSGDEFDEQTWAGFMAAQGTHTILDVRWFVPAELDAGSFPGGSTMRQVSTDEVFEVFGHGRPTRAEWLRLESSSPPLDDDGRGTGRCVVIYESGAPAAVAFWGHSGD